MELTSSNIFGGLFKGKTVLVTGHTGFKGSWISLWLYLMGANVVGYALPPVTPKDNYVLTKLQDNIIDIRDDIRNPIGLKKVFDKYKPEIVFHLAAQPIVRRSYANPVETFETNVMGTINVLEQIRLSDTARVGVIITSDKCYENKEQIWGYRENDSLGGYDPYSASKGCAELVTASYLRSFFNQNDYHKHGKSIATVRAGNVIGGGDWAQDRIIPDCIRALEAQKPITIRNPNAVRPWQFVLDPLYGYLLLASHMIDHGEKYSGAWNFGPEFDSISPVKTVADMMIDSWGSGRWIDGSNPNSLHEASLLNLDCTKAKTQLGWKPHLNLHNAIDSTISWYKNYQNEDAFSICENQIAEFYAIKQTAIMKNCKLDFGVEQQ